MTRESLRVAAFLGLLACPLAGQNPELYQRLCDSGDMLGCDLLGLMYRDGAGVTQNLPHAAELFQQACDGDMAESCSRLGVMYAGGVGVPQDVARALDLSEKACNGGHTQGCNNFDTLAGLMRVALLGQLPLENRMLAIGVEGFGTLSDADPVGPDGSYVQAWALQLSAGQEVTANLISSDFDPYLWVTGPGFDSGLSDDDSGGGCNARITFTAPEDGEYRAIVSTPGPGETGEFVLRASDTPPATASGPCSRVVGGDSPAVPVYASTDELPCEYEVIETVSGSSSRTSRSLADLLHGAEIPPLWSIRADVLGRAGADIGADAVIASEIAGGTQRRGGTQGRVIGGGGAQRPGPQSPPPQPRRRFSGEAIRFIPGTCRTAE